MSKQTLSQQTVLIDKSASLKTPVVIFEYEYPVLEELYEASGLALLTVLEEKSVSVDDFDPEQAYQSLKAKYRSREAQEAVRRAYPSASAFAKQFKSTKKAAQAPEEGA